MKYDVKKRILLLAALSILTSTLSIFFLDERVSQCIVALVCIFVIVLTVVKGLELNGVPDLVAAVLPMLMPILIKGFSGTGFSMAASEFYTKIAVRFFDLLGKEYTDKITQEMSITFTFVLLFIIFELIHWFRDNSAMKVLHKSRDEELLEKNFTQKSEAFCKTLRQWLEAINRETNWNENQFTPLEAEVEMDRGGKRKKKYDDLINCLKNNRNKNTVFLVLGSPGAGKSVSLRKLCLDLLDESKRTKKIPVYVNLKEWDNNWNLENIPTKKDLINFIRKKTLSERADFLTESFLNQYFDKMLEDGRWYFVFDSFDEMPCLMGKKNCQGLIDKISELLYEFMTGPNQSGGVVASRLYKSPSAAIGATVTLKIQDFNDIKIKKMIQNYLPHANQVIEQLFGEREDLVALCRNPFYLALLINYINDNGLVLPESQMKLYSSFVDERLNKCAERIELEKLTKEEICNAARDLAVFMQDTEGCGLECSTKNLYTKYRSDQQRRAFKVLEYAKICRMGGQNESISFVHRRFQEFFLVKTFIEPEKVIGQEEYKSIVNRSGLRDALVLYCEITSEEKAIEMADFCWKVIQDNIGKANNIRSKESLELISVLYFMREAFRNRRQALVHFEADFYQMVKDILMSQKKNRRIRPLPRSPIIDAEEAIDRLLKKSRLYRLIWEEKKTEETLEESEAATNGDAIPKVDFVVLLALINVMILFTGEQLQQLVVSVFKLNNRWLNDVIMQNCRVLKRLNYSIEIRFVKYFCRMDPRIFFRRFFNNSFSLSLSSEFRFVKRVHSMLLAVNVSCMVMTAANMIAAILSLRDLVVYIMKTVSDFQLTMVIPNIDIMRSNFTDDIMQIRNHHAEIVPAIIGALILLMFLLMLSIISNDTAMCFRNQAFILSCNFCIIALINVDKIGIIHNIAEMKDDICLMIILGIYALTVVIYSIAWLTLMNHEFWHVKKTRNLLKESLNVFLKALVIIVGSILLIMLALIICFFLLKFVIVPVILTLFFIINFFIFLYKAILLLGELLWKSIWDWRFIHEKCEPKKLLRTDLKENLEKLHLNKRRYQYLEALLLRKVELIGEWPDQCRPQYDDDRVEYAIAKLDCFELDSCNYLF